MDRNAIITKTVKQKWRLALAAITSRSERSSEEERESAVSASRLPCRSQKSRRQAASTFEMRLAPPHCSRDLKLPTEGMAHRW
jgi:hypothetical protein